jgi:hypothetical protein
MGIQMDAQFRLLANDRRRAFLATLDSEESPVELTALARRVATTETDGMTEEVEESPRIEDVAVSLRHVHVPMLADAGVVEFDADRQTVATGPEFETVRSLFEDYRESKRTLPTA